VVHVLTTLTFSLVWTYHLLGSPPETKNYTSDVFIPDIRECTLLSRRLTETQIEGVDWIVTVLRIILLKLFYSIACSSPVLLSLNNGSLLFHFITILDWAV
jgi:hypothetical protein